MKLPVIVNSSLAKPESGAGQFYSVSSFKNPTMPGVEMNGIFDSIIGGIGDIISGGISKIPCVLSKAGPQGIACLTQCGPNPACLASCAGPNLVQSIMSCL